MNPLTTQPESDFEAGKTGLFQIQDTLYHDHLRAPDISRGLIVEMITRSPAHAKAVIDGSGKKVTAAMTIGTLMDKALLEPDRFAVGVSHWVRPPGMKFTTKEGKAWQEEHLEAADVPIIYAEEEQDIKGMLESVMRHKKAKVIVERSIKQESAFCLDGETGLMRKVRPDMRLADSDGELTLTDLKSTFVGGATPTIWSKHCARMGYHYQDSFYGDTYKDLVGLDRRPWFLFIIVERKPPYAVRVYQIHPDGIAAARERIKQAMDTFRTCRESGEWPAYPETIETIRLPKWELLPVEPIVVE